MVEESSREENSGSMGSILCPPGSLDAREFRYGDIRSLHHTLDTATVARLEEAALCCCLRDFDSAAAIFQAFPVESLNHPVVAYYHSQVYWLQWLLFKCADILDRASTTANQFLPQFENTGIYTLLRLFRGSVQYYAEGHFTLVRDSVREIRSWLFDVPIQLYTDVQVHCLVRYYLMLLIVDNVTTDFDANFFQSIPHGWNQKAPTRLTPLREYLQNAGRLTEARTVLDTELALCANPEDQLSACRSLLEASSTHIAHEPIWWIAGRTQLKHSQTLQVLGQSQEARQQLDTARESLMRVRAPGKSNRAELFSQLQELKVASQMIDDSLSTDNVGLLERYEVLSNDPHVQRDAYILSTALTRALVVAVAIIEKDPSSYNRDVFWKWSTKTETLLEQIGDIADLYINRLATGDIACAQFFQFAATIKWHENFDAKYPNFNLWRSRINAKKTLQLIYTRIRNQDQAMKIIIDMKNIAADQDSFWSEEGFRPQHEVASRGAAYNTDQGFLPVAIQTEFRSSKDWLSGFSKSLPAQYWTTWDMRRIEVGSDMIKASTEVEEVLLAFMRDEFAKGVLSRNDLQALYSGLFSQDASQSSEESMDHLDFLNTITPEALSTILYGIATSPTPEKQWAEIFGMLSVWLLNKSARPENERHFLLFQVQNCRQSKAWHSNSPYETKAAETQRLIDLIPSLNKTVQEHVSSNFPHWRSLVAFAKVFTYTEKNNHPFLDIECPEFAEVLGLYKQCLEENYGNNRFIREVQTQVYIAHLYFHAAFRLNQQAMGPFFQALDKALTTLEKIRDGWRALEGWERVQCLTQALEDRTTMAISPWAVAVISQFPDTHGEVRDNMIWTMIQVAKSMGLGWLLELNAGLVRDSEGDTATGASKNPNNQEGDERLNSGPQQPLKDGEDRHVESGDAEDLPGLKMVEVEPKEAPHDQKIPNNMKALSGRNQDSEPTGGDAHKPAANEEAPDTTIEDMQAKLQLMSDIGGGAVFVDWYNGTSVLQPFAKPLIATISPGEKPKCCIADITWATIDKIVERFIHLDTSDLMRTKTYKILYELNPLVEPLAKLSKPGQVLAFSPCGNLHRIPLHALKIDGEALIQRNPIVYNSSLSALITAFETRQRTQRPSATTTSQAPPSPLRVAFYGDPPTPAGIAAMHATASTFNTEPHTGPAFTASLFTATLQSPNLHLVHYHGHAHFSQTSPMNQSLELADRHLSLRDIFDIPPGRGRGFHTTMLGCGSGASTTAMTDDVIGLVPRFFHAGARSAAASLWLFADGDAALYSEYLYGEVYGVGSGDGKVPEEGIERVKGLEGGVGSGDGEVLKGGIERLSIKREEEGSEGNVDAAGHLWNLAKANQKAVLKIREQKPQLYHWAAFVLSGWWMMRVPNKRLDRKEPDTMAEGGTG